jgi:branched-chain amino acid transport system substrate-binding protein
MKSFKINVFQKLSFLALVAASHGASAAANLKVGVFLPMSGNVANYGNETIRGIKMALEEINKGKDINITYVLEDDKSDVTDAANAVKKLINVDKVNVVVGSVPSSNTNAAAPIAQAAHIPLLTPSSTNVNVTKKGEYISRICFIDDFQGYGMAKFATETLKAKTAAIVTDSASDYSQGLAAAFKTAFLKMGGTITTEVSYVAKDQDFSSQLTKVRTRKPDVVFAPGYYNEVANMIRQAKTLGLKSTFLGGDGWSAPELHQLGGDAIVGHYYSDHFSSEDVDPRTKEFVGKFTKLYKQAPSAMAALGYDSMYVLADVVKRTGGKVDGKSLMTAINATKGYQAITGTITLDANRNPVKPLVVLETQRNRAVFKQRINP